MRIDVLTLFPAMFEGVISESIVKRARDAGVVDIRLRNFRDEARGRHQKVDDTPYGGGPGMVIQCEPVVRSVRRVLSEAAGSAAPEAAGGKGQRPRLIMLTPQGRTLTQALARELAKEQWLLMLCGHYEGFDERIHESFEWDEVSIGDYVLTGGELPAMVLMDAVVRLLPGALGDETSTEAESFEQGLLDYPHYSRPPEFEGRGIPEVLLSGHHANIAKWRLEQSEERTRKRRPDLWAAYLASKQEKQAKKPAK